MGTFDEYLERAKDLADNAGEVAKKAAGDVVSKAKELTEEGSEARKLVKNAREEASALSLGAKEKVQGMLQDARAVKKIKQGLSELEALPEIEGSILYQMEIESLVNYLRALSLLIDDKRLDDDSVAEEIRKVMDKVQPSAEATAEESALQEEAGQLSDEERAIENAKEIAYNACKRAMETLN